MFTHESAHAEVTVAQAAARLGVHDRTVRRYIREGILPAERVGPRLLRIKVADLDRFGEEVTPTDPIREAAVRVVSEAPRLTADQLDKICTLLRGVA